MKIGNSGAKGGTSTKTGLVFEKSTSLEDALLAKSYKVSKNKVFHNDVEVAILCGKGKFYTDFLDGFGIDWKKIVTRRLIPDDAIYVPKIKRVTIIEKKYQQTDGSVDEKLQTSGFKLKQYRKLVEGTSIEVKFIYVLNDWFHNPRYKDVLDYIKEVKCDYFFNEIPIEVLGLPK
jgi:hypothetical protein